LKAILTIGISGSGKSTWASLQYNEFDYEIINRDNLRWQISGTTGWKDYKFNKKIEKAVTEAQEALIVECAKYGNNIIIADTNLNPATRERLIKLCESLGFEVEIKEFPITLEEAWKRDQFRGVFSVGRDVIYKQWQQWLDYKGERYVPDLSKPKAAIFDIDGTLAHMDGKRGAFEWSKVGGDSLDANVLRILDAYFSSGYKILIVSGRDNICREETKQWLLDKDVIYHQLNMRSKGDMRKDTIVKKEIFDIDIAPHYNVEVVFDDRPSVVRGWLSIGIPKVICVGDPYLEF